MILCVHIVIDYIQVVAVLAHHIREVERVQGAIVVYRNLKDVVRTQYAVEHGPGAFLEAPMASYYGNTIHPA